MSRSALTLGASAVLAVLLSGCNSGDDKPSTVQMSWFSKASNPDLSANLLSALQTEGVNEVVQLTFWPTGGGSYDQKTGNFTNCPTGNVNESIVDEDCIGDQYESCLLMEFCGGSTCKAAEQLQLVKFLACFEHEHKADMNFAVSCATKAGFDATKSQKCLDDKDDNKTRLAAYETITKGANATGQNVTCFPWVLLNNQTLSSGTGACLGDNASSYELIPAFCKAMLLDGVALEAVCFPDTTTTDSKSFLM